MTTFEHLIRRLSIRTVCTVLVILPAVFIGFHGLVLKGVFPRNIVWGGRLTDATFLPLELLAIAINLLLILTGGVAGGFIASPTASAFVDRLKWFLFYFTVVNAIAGLFSTTMLEVCMTPVTALYALCLYRIIKYSDDVL